MPKKTPLAAVAALLCLLLFSACLPADGSSSSTPQSVASSQPTPAVPMPPAQYLEVPAPALQNNLLGEAAVQNIGVLLPPGYHEGTEEYPVLYYLTGYSEGYEARTETFAGLLQELYSTGDIEPMIVVVVKGQNRLAGGWYANSPVSGNWEDYIVKDLVDFVDGTLRTIKDASARCLSGHSMGGAGALHVAMRHPGLFGSLYIVSPAIIAPDGWETLGVVFDLVEMFSLRYTGMDPEEAHQQFIDDLATLDTSFYWTMAYATAFAGDASLPVPYVLLPGRNEDGSWMQDEAWQRYYEGIGALDTKVEQYGANLLQLRRFTIEYGFADDNRWIPPGCAFLVQQLAAQGVPHEVYTHTGGHNSHVDECIRQRLLPFFSGIIREGGDAPSPFQSTPPPESTVPSSTLPEDSSSLEEDPGKRPATPLPGEDDGLAGA